LGLCLPPIKKKAYEIHEQNNVYRVSRAPRYDVMGWPEAVWLKMLLTEAVWLKMLLTPRFIGPLDFSTKYEKMRQSSTMLNRIRYFL
jgi:hypothetical protein